MEKAVQKIIHQAESQISNFLPGKKVRVLVYTASSEKDSFEETHFNMAFINDLLTVISKEYSITKTDLFGKNRRPWLVEIRQIIWLIMRDDLRMSLNDIGRIFDRHHVTIRSGIIHIQDLLEVEINVLVSVQRIQEITKIFLQNRSSSPPKISVTR